MCPTTLLKKRQKQKKKHSNQNKQIPVQPVAPPPQISAKQTAPQYHDVSYNLSGIEVVKHKRKSDETKHMSHRVKSFQSQQVYNYSNFRQVETSAMM